MPSILAAAGAASRWPPSRSTTCQSWVMRWVLVSNFQPTSKVRDVVAELEALGYGAIGWGRPPTGSR